MKKTIYPVSERTNKVSSKAIQAVRHQHYTPTFEILKSSETVTSDACTAELVVTIQGETSYITGSSRRAKDDRSDYEVGYYVALSRAHTKLANKLRKRAEGLVRHHDNVQKHQEIVKAARAVAKKAAAKKAAAPRKAVAKKAVAPRKVAANKVAARRMVAKAAARKR